MWAILFLIWLVLYFSVLSDGTLSLLHVQNTSLLEEVRLHKVYRIGLSSYLKIFLVSSKSFMVT